MVAYVLKRQNTFAQYIVTRPILYLYEKTVQMPGGCGFLGDVGIRKD